MLSKILDVFLYAKHVDVSRVNKMWKKILKEMSLDDLSDNAIQVTGYHASSQKFLYVLEDLLRDIFPVVRTYQVENAPWRTVFLCKNEEEQLLVCAAWYHTGPDF